MLSIHTNYTSLLTQNNLNKTSGAMDNAMQRISTGFRINSAADDAAGLQIATMLQSQSNGLNVAQRNSQDAISMMQTAEGAFDEMTNIAHRMKDLATQAANGTNGADELAAMDAEYKELKDELGTIMTNTEYGAGNKLLEGGMFAGAVNFQIGASSADQLTVDVSGEIGAVSGFINGLGDLTTAGGQGAEMDKIDELLGGIGEVRSAFGANINRLDHTITNLGNMRENTEMAKGRIMDTDYAVESSNMMKNQMLTQMSMSMLSQANGMSGMVMSLVG
ncbi:lateral flagellin LafA [Photobacterium sp. DA100]|uniref:lateral flagellin LafA n=1 Tax=Photobacterium sp. DA100 TaxID=3027472 RepID=UPI002478E6C4|nr:lateral flagellin LafA [Photobacterium sp. DA100]WEM43005.1 lateral flagellin LafA [Photobacterium sp. DA100]